MIDNEKNELVWMLGQVNEYLGTTKTVSVAVFAHRDNAHGLALPHLGVFPSEVVNREVAKLGSCFEGFPVVICNGTDEELKHMGDTSTNVRSSTIVCIDYEVAAQVQI